MENVENKLSIRNLKISFRTDGGKVQAVRNIDFDLKKGETLAIVGESGSGKSVTSRAILGILANNAIKEDGEILYDGQDLMKISEEEFCKIRGDKIAMIFQDPLSSLNPIMRVGKQMTEAMLIKGKLSQKRSRKDFNEMLARLNDCMDEARGNTPEVKAINKALCTNFDKFECKHLELENAFLEARENCIEGVSDIDDILFRIEKHSLNDVLRDTAIVLKRADDTFNDYVVKARADELKVLIAKAKSLIKVPVADKLNNLGKVIVRSDKRVDHTDYEELSQTLNTIRDILDEASKLDEPNFFSMGYYLTFAKEPLPDMPVSELNPFLRKYLDDNFMLDFIAVAKDAVKFSHQNSIERKKNSVKIIEEQLLNYTTEQGRAENGFLDEKLAKATAHKLFDAVADGINPLDTIKDNIAYTFESSIRAAVDTYFGGIINNEREEKRYEKEMDKYNQLVAAGKNVDYTVADKKLVDLEGVCDSLVDLIVRVKNKYQSDIDKAESTDYDALAVEMIDYLKLKASGVAHKVTRSMAKNRALKLLEEVGIPEPRKRYKQYPFEFSGGMRQRIVIAIALSANPDILICDEPTTALDVTIQSQILELINRVKEERQLSVIFITHDLGVVANMADRVAVMYAGKIVEIGTAEDIFYSPAHPYTWALLSSMPDLDTKEKLEAIPGTPPNMIYPPKGDAFAERNKYALQIDYEQQPPMFKISDTHSAATWLLHPNAPKVEPPKIIADRIARMRKKSEEAESNAVNESEAVEASELQAERADVIKAVSENIPDEHNAVMTELKEGIVDDAQNASTVSTEEEQAVTTDEVVATAPKAKKTTAKKSTTAKTSTAKKTTAAKTSTAKKSTTTTKKTADGERSTAKKSTTAKSSTAKKSTTASKSTAAKKSTTAKKSTAKIADESDVPSGNNP